MYAKKEFQFWENAVGNTEDLATAFREALPSCTAGNVSHLVADYAPSNLRLVPLPDGIQPASQKFVWSVV